MNNDPIFNTQDIIESERPNVSPAVIKRLPRYFRYLRELGAMWVRPKDGEVLPPCVERCS